MAFFISFVDVGAAFSAYAGLETYQPTNPDSAYNISFFPADEKSYNLAIYEKVNEQWQKNIIIMFIR